MRHRSCWCVCVYVCVRVCVCVCVASINAESKADDAWAWTVIESYFEQSGMVRQQIDSFDKFLEFTVPAVVEEQRLIEFQTESRDPADPRVRV